MTDMSPGELQQLWGQCGHRIAELEYQGTQIHRDLIPLVSQNGELYIPRSKGVFKVILNMKQDLGK